MDDQEAPVHLLDHRLLRDRYGTTEMRAVFSDLATINGWISVESAIAAVQAGLGIIPHDAAGKIQDAAAPQRYDFKVLREGFEKAGHPLIPVLKWLEQASGEAGEYVHWGATTQDILDTGLAMQLKQGNSLISAGLDRIRDALAGQVRAHRDTVMAGRTHGQHAVPVTLGMKLGIFLAEVRRHKTRLANARAACEQVQFSGAVGTLATLAGKGDVMRRGLAQKLDLNVPETPWHSCRDNLCELISVLASISASCGKICNEVVNLQRSEIGELAEPAGRSAVGSSTMPQKRNPMRAQEVVTIARLMTGQPGRMLTAAQHEHERDMAAWQMEWAVIPESFVYTHAALEKTAAIIEDLHVDKLRMRKNLAASGGLINAENVMMALAVKIGRETAHELIMKLTRDALENDTDFASVLKQDPICQVELGETEIHNLLQPENYIGEAQMIVDDILARSEE